MLGEEFAIDADDCSVGRGGAERRGIRTKGEFRMEVCAGGLGFGSPGELALGNPCALIPGILGIDLSTGEDGAAKLSSRSRRGILLI